ncbi:hypothetical protein [Kribbella sp. NPDC051770]|uniref:hypothetical protein n=1 Tax=Kribbella sp. NPDC051770 TaxID=3155413 RepID=UPI0034371A14
MAATGFFGGQRYRIVWTAVVGFLLLAGAGAAVLLISPTTCLMTFVMGAGTVGSVYLSAGLADGRPGRQVARQVAKWSLRSGALALALCGYVVTAGWTTIALVVAVAATSPYVVKHLWTPASTVEQYSDEELCLAWCLSTTALESAGSADERLAITATRLSYLDELERRQPESFTAWMETTPGPAADPSDFFVRTDHHTSPE